MGNRREAANQHGNDAAFRGPETRFVSAGVSSGRQNAPMVNISQTSLQL
jgi:hypothetical protein